MHPPFLPPVTGVSHDTSPLRRRRGAPEALRLTPVVAGWPPRPLNLADPVTVYTGTPAPGRGLRAQARLGRFLIRLGQRMLLPTLRADRPRLTVME